MRILITGAAGFIGSNLMQRCIDEGWVVTGVDDMSNGHWGFLPDKRTYREFIHSDFASPDVLRLIESQWFDIVFHLAAVPRVSYSVEHPLQTHDVNVTRTLEMMNAARRNVKRIVFASSSSVYGGAGQLPTSEDVPKRPKSPYALQKSIIEDYLAMYGDLYGLDSISLRFFNVFGENALGCSPYATALAAWVTSIKSGKSMRSDGDGLQSRDLCHVKNVVEACVLAAKADHGMKFMGRCYNVACGDRTTNRELLNYLLKRYNGSTYVEAPERSGDVKHTLADISRARDELGYSPIVRVWEGVERTCDWYDQNWSWVKDLKLNA